MCNPGNCLKNILEAFDIHDIEMAKSAELPGTKVVLGDVSKSFTQHKEVELYLDTLMTTATVLKRQAEFLFC